MSLVSTQEPCQRISLDGVSFPMLDSETNKRIVVLVTDEAIQDVSHPPPGQDEYIARCESYRDRFEAIAMRKFEQGKLNGYGNIDIDNTDL